MPVAAGGGTRKIFLADSLCSESRGPIVRRYIVDSSIEVQRNLYFEEENHSHNFIQKTVFRNYFDQRQEGGGSIVELFGW